MRPINRENSFEEPSDFVPLVFDLHSDGSSFVRPFEKPDLSSYPEDYSIGSLLANGVTLSPSSITGGSLSPEEAAASVETVENYLKKND